MDSSVVLQHLSSLVLLVSANGTIVWASPSLESQCGWSPTALRGLQWHTLVHPGDLSKVRDIQTTASPTKYAVELRLRSATNQFRWHRMTMDPMSPEPNAEFVIEFVDINNEVKLRKQSHIADASLRRLFDDLSESVVEWEPIRDSSGRIVDLYLLRCNRAFNDRFGGQSVEGRRASAFFPLAISKIPAMEALTEHGGESLHNVEVGPDVYQLHLSATSHGTVVGISRRVAASEIGTDSPAAQEQREHLARVAHTLRTNLSVVQGWTELLVDADAADDAETRHQAVEHLARNTSTLLTSVNDLMGATSGKYGLSLAPTGLTRILQDAVEDLETTHPDIAFALTCEQDLVALTNASALSNVLQHLLENAARFAKSTVAVTAERQDMTIVIDVVDDGPGIAADVELFKAFTPNHRGHGNGVGLNVVKKLVDAIGGTVTGENRDDGSGARFRVTIPAAQTELSSR